MVTFALRVRVSFLVSLIADVDIHLSHLLDSLLIRINCCFSLDGESFRKAKFSHKAIIMIENSHDSFYIS